MMKDVQQQLRALAVFMDLHKDPVFEAFCGMLDCYVKDPQHLEEAAAYFTGLLYREKTEDWSEYLQQQILGMNTCLSWFASTEHELPERMVNTAMKELQALSKAAAISPAMLNLPARSGWAAGEIDLQAEYLNRLMLLDLYGTGVFARGKMFRLRTEKPGHLEIVPVSNPDPVGFEQLYGYESQHLQMLENTRALLKGLPSSNLLLYGDAGTGKSASIKALENRFAKKGLRLIEVSKKQLEALPDLMDQLAEEPLKFILFIDDLTFGEQEDSFGELKAILEGSVSARAKNTVIYATSNRRHLIRESASARAGDDMHRRDTLQETLSLSQRFGQCIFFERPNADEYKALIARIGQEFGLNLSDEATLKEAEAFALSQGGRSARVARQFAETRAARKGM